MTEKPKKIRRISRPKAENSVMQANNALISIFNEVLETLRKGIDVGNVNMPQGIMSLVMLADFLHGGAYAAPFNELPFYLTDPSLSKFWSGNTATNQGADAGLTGDIANVFGVQNADYTFREIMQNANVPHVFPKILSDQTFSKIVATFQWLTTQEAFTKGVTGIATLVKTGGEAVKNIGAGVESATANTEDVAKALTSLLPLVKAAVP